MSGLRLEGKRALVTGAGTGIGRSIALEFARAGADVVVHYSHSSAGAEAVSAEIAAMGRKTAAMRAEFTDLDQVQDLGRRAAEFLGGIDCLVNNAGISFNTPFLKTTREQFDICFGVNIRAMYFLTQTVVEDMLKHGGGQVVNLTSVHAISAAAEHSVYASTKAAIVAFTRNLGVEMAHKGIRVNAIAPGMVPVDNHKKAKGYVPGSEEKVAYEKIPLGRYGSPEEIGKLAVFLCSDEAGFIIGQTIFADGGTTSLMSLMPEFREELGSSLGVGYIPGV